jgi:hypothetical protein
MYFHIIDTVLTDISLSHSLKCPLGGGFWVYAPEHGALYGCTDDGQPICLCGPSACLTFADGTVIQTNVSREFVEKLIPAVWDKSLCIENVSATPAQHEQTTIDAKADE